MINKSSAESLRKQGKHYTVLPSDTLKSIKSADALAIWVYLQSQSEGFIVRPSHIQQQLDIGEQRYSKAIRMLREMKLLVTAHERDARGHIIGNYVDCYPEPITETPENPDFGKTQNPGKPESGETGSLIKDQVSNQESKEQSSTDDKHPTSSADRRKTKRPSTEHTIEDFLEYCKTNQEKAIPETHAVMTYAKTIGLPNEMLRLAWLEFKSRHIDSGKKYKDWRQAFHNCVKGNWYKLWWLESPEAGFKLTTVGIQADMEHKAHA